MAKVVNLIFDETALIYIDADGESHYTGEKYRNTLTRPIPDPFGRPWSVVKVSAKEAIPSRRGIVPD